MERSNGRILWKDSFDVHSYNWNNFGPTPDIFSESYFITPDAYLGGTELKPRRGLTKKSEGNDLVGAWDIVYDVTHCDDPNYRDARLVDFPAKIIINNQKQYVPAAAFRPLEIDLAEICEFMPDKFSTIMSMLETEEERKQKEKVKPEPPHYYEVQDGDTLASIARKEKSLARAIARANGYANAYAPLKPGEKIRIPLVEHYTNNVDDETPYAKIRATIIGSIYPDLTIIPPPLEDDDNDDFFHQALRVLVPIVLTIVLGPAGLQLNMVATAAISNIVSQIIFVSTGLQRDISLTSLLVTTLTAGVGDKIGSLTTLALEEVGEHLVKHAMLNLTGQLLEVAAGLQDELDFKQMATAAVNGVINDAVSLKTRTLSNSMKALGSGLSTGINMGVASVIQGVPFNTERALVQMAGTGLGAYASIEINEYRARQKSEVHQEISQAAQSKDAKGVSQTHYARNKGPGFFAKPKTEESLIKPIRPEDVIATLDAGRGYWPEPHSALDYAGAYGRGIGNAVANDARHFVTHNFMTSHGAEERFILMVETALFLNSSLSNKYEVLSHLAGNLVQSVETRYHQYQAADGLERAYMLGHDTEEAAKFLGGGLIGRGLFGAKTGLIGLKTAEKLPNFTSPQLLERHFIKHSEEFKGVFTNSEEYLAGAHDVMKNGIKVAYDYKGEMRVGYVRFAGTKSGKPIIDDIRQPGVAKFELVGTNKEGNITTYHIESGKDFWRTINNNPYNKNIEPYSYIKPNFEVINSLVP